MRSTWALAALLAVLIPLGGCGGIATSQEPGPECADGTVPVANAACPIDDAAASTWGQRGRDRGPERGNGAALRGTALHKYLCDKGDLPRRECLRRPKVAQQATASTLDEWLAGNYPTRDGGKSCRDVTTEDWNWDNDMLCTRADGSQFHTDYAGADAFLGR